MIIFTDKKVLFLALFLGFWLSSSGIHPARAQNIIGYSQPNYDASSSAPIGYYFNFSGASSTFVVDANSQLYTAAWLYDGQGAGSCQTTGVYRFYLNGGGADTNWFYGQNCDGPWYGDGNYHWTKYDFLGPSPCSNGPYVPCGSPPPGFGNGEQMQGWAPGYAIGGRQYAMIIFADKNSAYDPNTCMPTYPALHDCQTHPSIASLQQYRSDAAAIIPGGGATTGNTLIFKALLTSSSTDPLQLEVEVQPLGTGFANAPNATSAAVASGQSAQAILSGLANGPYHWQARAVDAVAHTPSLWKAFGQGASADFSVVRALAASGTVLTDLTDASTTFSAGTGYYPVFGATPMSPNRMFYEAPASFNIDRLQVDDADLSNNNHDGIGNIRAWIYDLRGDPIASSTNAIYGERSCSGCAFQFRDQLIPKDFQLGLIVEDGIQGDGGFTVGNLRFHQAAERKNPVVIVPGVMGSYLDRASDGTEVWPNISNMLLSGSDSYLDDLALSSSGRGLAGKEMNAPDIIRTAGIVPVFKPLIDSFKDAGYVEGEDLFVAPYDWRMGIASSAARVGAVIRNAIARSETGQINIIAHSMGGLVVKDYLARATSTQFLDKLILLGVPQLGAPKTFITLNYGDDLGLRWFGLGLNKNKIKEISQNMPGIYELLPSRRYVDVAGGYVQDWRGGESSVLSYDGTAALMTSDPGNSRNSRLLGEADATHGRLDGAAFNAPNVYNVVGCHMPTIAGFNVYDGGVFDVVRAGGDGTVPEVSAMNLANGFHNYFVLGSETGVDHTGLIKGEQPLALVRAIIGGNVSGTGSLPPGISTSLADCVTGRSTVGASVETTIEISSHSPAALNAYDAAGRHTGPNASGDIEVQIPGSSYEAIEGNSFILLPASDAYRIVADGLAAGTLTLKRKGYDAGAKLLRTTTYLQVPLASASTTATLFVGSSTPASDVSLDLDGDGTADQTIHPAALLATSSSADIAPPILTASPIPTAVIAGATTTVTFSFADAGSGVATSSATMNGQPFISGQAVLFGTPGTTTISFFAEDAAGNPSVREYYVSVAPREAPRSCSRAGGRH